MLSVNDYNHIKLLYEQFFKTNKYLRKLFETQDWTGVETALEQKDDLIRKIIFFEKSRKKELQENKELMNFKKELIELEKENIALVTNMRNIMRKEIQKVSKAKAILKSYEPSIQEEPISRVDIICED